MIIIDCPGCCLRIERQQVSAASIECPRCGATINEKGEAVEV